MQIVSFTGGPARVNTYILFDDDKNCVIIDPSEIQPILDIIKDNRLSPRSVILTHGHFDHFWALDDLLKSYHVPVYIHSEDAKMLTNNELNLAVRFGFDIPSKFMFDDPILINDGDILKIGGMEFRVIHTPGHTSGGVCFLVGSSLFTGDTLFSLTVGRTDCYTADVKQLKKSIDKLKTFNDDIKIYPGHGRSSDMKFEKRYNPFMNGGFDYYE